MTRTERAQTVVIFDFDGTLVSRDSFFDFALGYCARRPACWPLVALLGPLALLILVRSERVAGALMLWAITLGTSTRAFVLAMREYARNTLPAYANEAIFSELERQVQGGNRVVVATGSMPIMARTLFRVRSHGPLPIVGSRARRRWGGLVVTVHCTRRIKVRELQSRLGIVEWASVYTDSFADRWLMSRAIDVTLVGPSRRTLARTRRLLGPDVRLRVLPAT